MKGIDARELVAASTLLVVDATGVAAVAHGGPAMTHW